jgi:hypothetical protein
VLLERLYLILSKAMQQVRLGDFFRVTWAFRLHDSMVSSYATESNGTGGLQWLAVVGGTDLKFKRFTGTDGM